MEHTNSEFILFKTEDQKISVDVRLDEQDNLRRTEIR
jgi:hypothetical protein